MSDFALSLCETWESHAPAAAAPPPIDLVRLARQSLGDQDLERELLAMFERQAARIVGQLAAAPSDDLKIRADLAHMLKGSALAVGADRVAEAAARLEAVCAEPAGQATLAAALAGLAGAVSEAREAIAKLLA
jgi:HPt (histidine-containing phosphotransfer) domain-containing protein